MEGRRDIDLLEGARKERRETDDRGGGQKERRGERLHHAEIREEDGAKRKRVSFSILCRKSTRMIGISLSIVSSGSLTKAQLDLRSHRT